MTSDGRPSYDASTMPGGLDHEVERLRQQALISWPKEARQLRWLGLAPQMTVLELGSGPGFVTEQLLQLVPQGSVVALERDAVLVARAEAYLGSRGLERWSIVRGDVMDTGLPAASFDFVYARYLFEHLPDPVGGAREAWRVLKPGGTLVVVDVDDDMGIFDPPGSPEMQALDARLKANIASRQAAGGGDRRVGRKLPRILRAAGFQDLEIDALVMHNGAMDISGLAPPPTRENMAPMVAAGLLSDADVQLIIAEDARIPEAERITIMMLLAASGVKPLTP